MSEKIKGMFGSETRASEVREWLESQGAENHQFYGNEENTIYYVYQGHVKVAYKDFYILFDIVELPRWRAKEGKRYYYASDWGFAESTIDDMDEIDNERYKCGNYFETEEEARPFAKKIREIWQSNK